jgi:three-Cys-motif partner protein
VAGSKRSRRGTRHQFGGQWTGTKLDILGRYLHAYTAALQGQPFKTAYIDAFAGTGYRLPSKDEGPDSPLFPLREEAPQQLLDGSARIALKATPPFDRYIFIERNRERARQLQALRKDFPELASRIEVREEEANNVIRDLCAKDWRHRRAVLFLDPYGMQVEWESIEAIASTRAIDLWVLFPLGVAVNRLLTRSGHIPAGWRRRLDLLLGRGWQDALYRVEPAATLFDLESTRVVKATTAAIGRYFNERLATVFAGVAPMPRVLLNSAHCPLYLLCFAAANPRGAPIAVRIARHLLEAAT